MPQMNGTSKAHKNNPVPNSGVAGPIAGTMRLAFVNVTLCTSMGGLPCNGYTRHAVASQLPQFLGQACLRCTESRMS